MPEQAGAAAQVVRASLEEHKSSFLEKTSDLISESQDDREEDTSRDMALGGGPRGDKSEMSMTLIPLVRDEIDIGY